MENSPQTHTSCCTSDTHSQESRPVTCEHSYHTHRFWIGAAIRIGIVIAIIIAAFKFGVYYGMLLG